MSTYRADPGEPPLSRENEILVWRDYRASYPPGDPLHWWASCMLFKAGLIDRAEKEKADDARQTRMLPLRPLRAKGRPPSGSR